MIGWIEASQRLPDLNLEIIDLQSSITSDLLLLPPPFAEQHRAHHRERGKGDRDRGEDAARSVARRMGEDVRERDLPEPEAEEVDPRRGPGVAGAVECLRNHHAV